MIDRRRVVGWVVWIAILALTTLVLMGMRGSIELANVALTMLLVVLGGSVAGGRALGFMLAALSFVLINYYFQSPYDYFTVNKPIDWIVLVDFLATAFVTTELLARARQQAEAAEARASEVETLSQLGAESLQYATAEQALEAIASLVQRVMGADNCTIIPGEVAQNDRDNAKVGEGESESDAVAAMERRASARAVELGRPVLLNADNVLVPHASADIAHPAAVIILTRQLALPLRAKERIIGVLAVRGDTPLILDGPRRRLLAALGYYAALAIERMRLMAEAAQSAALREAQRAKDEIFAAVSHDLRTPLTTIKVLAQSGASRGEPSSMAIVEQADRLARMVGDLLELSMLRTGSINRPPELNTADDLVGAAMRQAEGMLNGRRIAVQLDFDSPALVGRFDFVHTLRIVGNLLDNALRHTPEGGLVELRAERDDRWLVFTVADRGAGVASDEKNRIFEAFYRPAQATPDVGHAGLGLSIARSLADLQGGSVSYHPRDGGGSIFELRLPAADIDDMAASDMGPSDMA
jgi:two-component system, OmpR family, sensor histidine kinase KdpD